MRRTGTVFKAGQGYLNASDDWVKKPYPDTREYRAITYLQNKITGAKVRYLYDFKANEYVVFFVSSVEAEQFHFSNAAEALRKIHELLLYEESNYPTEIAALPQGRPKKYDDPSKSYVTMLRCPWCGKDTGELALDRRMRNIFDMHTNAAEPCKDCMKDAIIMYDKDSKKFIGYGKKKAFMDEKNLEKFKGAPVKALVKIEGDHIQFFNPPGG